MQLQLSTWPEVEAYLKQSDGIIIPVGSTEQHGPTGVFGIDAMCPEIIAEKIGDATGAMVGPTLPVGMAQHHMAFPGTATLRPSTMMALVDDVVTSLSCHGFRHFYFLNGHGGNVTTMNAAFSELYTRASLNAGESNERPLRCRLRNWWVTPQVKKLRDKFYGGAEGMHATPSEIAVTQYADARAIKQAELTPVRAPVGDFHDAADFRKAFPDGRIGSDPSLATPEHGGEIVAAAAADIGEDYKNFLRE